MGYWLARQPAKTPHRLAPAAVTRSALRGPCAQADKIITGGGIITTMLMPSPGGRDEGGGRGGQADLIITNPTVPFKARLKARPTEEIVCSNPSLFPDPARPLLPLPDPRSSPAGRHAIPPPAGCARPAAWGDREGSRCPGGRLRQPPVRARPGESETSQKVTCFSL